jgi:hypothetical protein
VRERWEFFGSDEGDWRWRLLDADTNSILRTSHSGFPNLFACVKDAESQGYAGFRDVKRSGHRILLSDSVGSRP